MKPRVFAEGLAIPLGILPYKNGVYVQHGPNIEFLQRHRWRRKSRQSAKIILSGFGVQDSHLFPHQFTRAPGNWIWMAQGAFNYGKVKTTKGAEMQFDQTRMAKFRYDGSRFRHHFARARATSGASCSKRRRSVHPGGERLRLPDDAFPRIRELPRLLRSPVEKLRAGVSRHRAGFPDGRHRPQRPRALRRPTTGPMPYDRHFLSSPTRSPEKSRRSASTKTARVIDSKNNPILSLSADELFRPVAIQFGPDGCLYIVDWYNKIISHNEVPRNHPDRDKTRGRIWRVKHKEAKPFEVPDFTKLSEDQLLAKLSDKSLYQTHLAWQTISDRQATALAAPLRKLAGNGNIAALWALEGLNEVDGELLTKMTHHPDHNVRREALRALSDSDTSIDKTIELLTLMDPEKDPEVRAQIIRTAT